MSIFNKRKLPEVYDETEINELEKYIIDKYGEFEKVLHELVSPDIHVDIAVIPPEDNRNYYTLVTMGMGAHRMNVPKELKNKADRAELVAYLPPEWDVCSDDEKLYWPIRCLKTLARLPIENNTWLSLGHTVQNREPYAENTKLCCALLFNAIDKNEGKVKALEMRNGKTINFYMMFPIYAEEMNYKISHNANALLKLIDDADISPVININRKNYCASI